jgi:hypothetical protein
MTHEMIQAGLRQVGSRLSLAFPVPGWRLDLELRVEVPLTAAQRTVLILASEGLGSVEAMARSMGLGEDPRLVASTALSLAELGCLAIADGRLVTTEGGEAMLSAERIVRRERVVEEVFYHPLDRQWTWKRPARTWESDLERTIELPESVASPRKRRDEVRDLLRSEGSPALRKRSANGQSPPVELVDLQELEPVASFEEVQVECWRRPDDSGERFVAYREDAYDPQLSRFLNGATWNEKRKRLLVRPHG